MNLHDFREQPFRKQYLRQFSLITTVVSSTVLGITFTLKSWASPVINHRDSVVEHLLGKMTASIQQAESEAVQVKMTTCLVNVAGDRSSIFLYQEQGFTDSLDKPYRQRFLEITKASEQKQQESKHLVLSRSYKPENLDSWINFCQSDRQKDSLNPADLGELVCTIRLKPLLSVYVGQTPPGGCPTTARGAATITNSIVLHEQGMETWDRGFDVEGKQLWGARQKPYQFFWDKGE